MAEFVRFASRADLPAEGQLKEFQVKGRTICVANIYGDYSAIENVCLHQGGPLSEGSIQGGRIICPWHGWAWDPETGRALDNPALQADTFSLRIEGDDVLIAI